MAPGGVNGAATVSQQSGTPTAPAQPTDPVTTKIAKVIGNAPQQAAAMQQQAAMQQAVNQVANGQPAATMQQPVQAAPSQPQQQPQLPLGNYTLNENELNASGNNSNGYTPHNNGISSTQYAQMTNPNGVTGSPATSADAQVAKLNNGGGLRMGGDGKRQPAAPQEGQQTGQPGTTGQQTQQQPFAKGLEDIYNYLVDNNPRESEEDRKKREKKERKKKMWGAIADGISALSNLYFANKGAPVQYDPEQTYSGKYHERLEQLRKEREGREKEWLSHYMRLLGEQRAMETAKENAAIRQKYYDDQAAHRERQDNVAKQNADTREAVGKSQVEKNRASTRESNAKAGNLESGKTAQGGTPSTGSGRSSTKKKSSRSSSGKYTRRGGARGGAAGTGSGSYTTAPGGW
jgi:hypothetical protein